MQRPVKRSDYYDYNDLVLHVEGKYGVKIRDYSGKYEGRDEFNEWCDSKGYGNVDSEGKHRGGSHIWFAEYQKDLMMGKIVEKPYQDFWHFLIDYYDGEISNGKMLDFNWEDILHAAEEDWQREVAQLFVDEFGREDMKVLVEW